MEPRRKEDEASAKTQEGEGKTVVKMRHKIGDEIIVLTEEPLRVKKFKVGGVLINDEGVWYNDGVNLGREHSFLEPQTFKNHKEALVGAEKVVKQKVSEYESNLLIELSKGEWSE